MTTKLKKRFAQIEMADGSLFEDVRITVADTVQYELTAAAKKWPTITVRGQTGTVLGQTLKESFECWHALTRLGDYDGTFEDFYKRDVADLTVDDEDAVDPTAPVVAAG